MKGGDTDSLEVNPRLERICRLVDKLDDSDAFSVYAHVADRPSVWALIAYDVHQRQTYPEFYLDDDEDGEE